MRLGLAAAPADAGCEAIGGGRVAAETEVNVRAWDEEPISKKHDREAFDCGEAALNEFLQHYARKAMRWVAQRLFLRSATPTTKRFSATKA